MTHDKSTRIFGLAEVAPDAVRRNSISSWRCPLNVCQMFEICLLIMFLFCRGPWKPLQLEMSWLFNMCV